MYYPHVVMPSQAERSRIAAKRYEQVESVRRQKRQRRVPRPVASGRRAYAR